MKNLFELIPAISPHITTENEGGLAVIAFPRFKNKFMQKYLIPRSKSPQIRIRLEAHGTAVWNRIDGRRTVQEIADALAPHFDQEPGYEYRIAAYIQQLHIQGFILLT